MLVRLLVPGVLLSLCIVVHALVVTAMLRRLSRSAGQTVSRFWPATWLLIRVALWMVAAHLVEIAIWAAFFSWHQMFPDLETSLYFSAVTYTTVGYGDLVLPLIVRSSDSHAGILPKRWGLIAASDGRVVISALKPSRDGGIAVRVYEPAGAALKGARLQFTVPITGVREANLIEDPGRELTVRNNGLSFDLQPFEIKTFVIEGGQ